MKLIWHIYGEFLIFIRDSGHGCVNMSLNIENGDAPVNALYNVSDTAHCLYILLPFTTQNVNFNGWSSNKIEQSQLYMTEPRLKLRL